MKSKYIIMSLLFSLTLTGCQINSHTSSSDSSSSVDTFTITWNNYDGTTLEVDESVAYGSMPSYDGVTPTKSGDSQYSYVFSGWSPEVSTVVGDATYTAEFGESVNTYTVTWKNYDGTVLEVDSDIPYGTLPSYDGATPSKGSSVQYTYAFSGWSPEVSTVVGDATYTAQFTSSTNTYTITWKNYNGKVLETDIAAYGSMPSYDGATPSKASSAQYTYTFSGWSPEVSMVVGDATYTAQFTSSTSTYTITWKNYDGTVLEVDSDIPYGTLPSYDGATPSKASSAQYTYTFSGWSPEVSMVTSNQSYIAQFTNLTNYYTITWQNYDGTILEVDSDIPYGTLPTYDDESPTKPSVSIYSYTWSGWSPVVTSVTGNQTYVAIFSENVSSNYLFGSYPQTKVTDSSLISQLNTAASTLPTSSDRKSWVSYKYYNSRYNSSDFMWYQDIQLNGEKYRGVYFTFYRPYSTGISSSANNSDQDDNEYYINTTYWFKFEPISWDVLSVYETSGPLVLSSKILDSQEYYHSTDDRTYPELTYYPNNYSQSDIRKWLNDSFINTAFSTSEQNLIKTTTVDNSPYSTLFVPNKYAKTNTNDKLFLLSQRETQNSDKGGVFSTSDSRLRTATDYAKAMGVYVNSSNGKSYWRLRSPLEASKDWVQTKGDGSNNVYIHYSRNYEVQLTNIGILPAFRINL